MAKKRLQASTLQRKKGTSLFSAVLDQLFISSPFNTPIQIYHRQGVVYTYEIDIGVAYNCFGL